MPNSTHIDHARHDPILIAGHASGDLSEIDRATADTLIATCEPCAGLRRDLVAIAAATRSLPAPATLRRDLRLDEAQAERLQRGGWLRRALRPFASPGSAFRPMAAAFTSLGVAGLLVAAVMPALLGSLGSPASAPAGAQERDLGLAGAPTSAAAVAPAASNPLVPVAASSLDGGAYAQESVRFDAASTDDKYLGGPASAAPRGALGGGDPTNDAGVRASEADRQARLANGPSLNPIVAGSLALLGVGLLLFGLRFAARRLR